MLHFAADAHCDLLSYLQGVPNASPFAEESRCSLTQLQQGGVALQTMAIFTTTQPGSVQAGAQQANHFLQLLTRYPDKVYTPTCAEHLQNVLREPRIALVAAIENASSFCLENEPLQNGFQQLDKLEHQLGKIFYISLTHHTENRFGGGNYTNIGLKEDGKRLLDYLANKRIAIDFSHASDALAYGILEHIDKNHLPLKVIASHSNFRAVHHHRRNLPDDIAKAIIQRGGIIGLTWLKAYVGNQPTDLLRHWQHGKRLGAAMVCGADLFYYQPKDFPSGVYFERYSNASNFLMLKEDMENFGVQKDDLSNFFTTNLISFLKNLWFN